MPYTSQELELPRDQNEIPFARADLRFLGVDHSGESYEGRIFLNNPEAGLETPADDEHGYAGSIYIFGHGHCWGDEGHCAVPPGPLHGFDHRDPHHLVPELHEVEVTGAVRRLIQSDTKLATVTVVPIVRRGGTPEVDDTQLQFSELQLVTYD
jgi:tyrosinase